MWDFLRKPLLWAFRQSLGKDRGTVAYNAHDTRLNALYKQITPDRLEILLDGLADKIESILETEKGAVK